MRKTPVLCVELPRVSQWHQRPAVATGWAFNPFGAVPSACLLTVQGLKSADFAEATENGELWERHLPVAGCSAMTDIPTSAMAAPTKSQRVKVMPSTTCNQTSATAMYIPP